MWISLWDELREVVWLASVAGALSIVGVGLAVCACCRLSRSPSHSVLRARCSAR
jgi:hypothetical protein